MTAHLCYLRYVLRHKWFVFMECWRLGIPLRGILHDWSKLLPWEWWPYAEHFYGEKYPSIHETHGDLRNHVLDSGRYQERVERGFDYAWLHHQKANKHHWQYWVLANDDGPVYPLPMPDCYRREMLADWKGTGRAVSKPDTRAWYLKQREKGRQNLHPETQAWVEEMLGL